MRTNIVFGGKLIYEGCAEPNCSKPRRDQTHLQQVVSPKNVFCSDHLGVRVVRVRHIVQRTKTGSE